MRLLPVFAPTLVASDASSIAAAEATTRGMWLITMGYVLGAIGAWCVLKHAARGANLALANLRQRAEAAREAHALAQARLARQSRARALSAHVAVRVQF